MRELTLFVVYKLTSLFDTVGLLGQAASDPTWWISLRKVAVLLLQSISDNPLCVRISLGLRYRIDIVYTDNRTLKSG